MLKIVLAIFLIAHGLVHAGLATAPNPADPEGKPGAFFTAVERSWLLPQLGLSGTAVTCFWAFWGIIENFHKGPPLYSSGCPCSPSSYPALNPFGA